MELGLAMLLIGQIIICIGSYFYIGASLGCGPRDALMVALGKRLPSVPIGAIRGLLEGTVLIIGWLLGAKVGMFRRQTHTIHVFPLYNRTAGKKNNLPLPIGSRRWSLDTNKELRNNREETYYKPHMELRPFCFA